MPQLTLFLNKMVVPSDISPVKAIARLINDNGTPIIAQSVYLNVDGTNTLMGQTDSSGSIDYTQNYSKGTHQVYAWQQENVSQVVTFQVQEDPEEQSICSVAITQLAQKTQCYAGEKLRFRVDVFDEEGKPYLVPDTVYIAYNNTAIDNNVTQNGRAFFDIIFTTEGKQSIFAYDANAQSDIWYMEVLPVTVKSPDIIFPANMDNNPHHMPVQNQIGQPVDLLGGLLGWLGIRKQLQ